MERPAPPGADPIYVAFDTETTGLSPVDDRVLEIGAVSFRIGPDGSGEPIDRFEQLVDPGIPIPPELTLIHGITDSMVYGHPTLASVLPDFLRFLESAGRGAPPVLVAHNSPYDVAMLLVPLARLRAEGLGPAAPGYMVLDTCAMAKVLLPGAPNHKLGTLASMLGIAADRAHRALADVETCRKLFLSMLGCPGVDPTPEGLARLSGSEMRLSAWDEMLDDEAVRTAPVLRRAIAGFLPVTIRYAGGTKGDGPRTVTPLALQRQGGILFLLGQCHTDRALKSFRLDRITHAASVVAAPPPLPLPPPA